MSDTAEAKEYETRVQSMFGTSQGSLLPGFGGEGGGESRKNKVYICMTDGKVGGLAGPLHHPHAPYHPCGLISGESWTGVDEEAAHAELAEMEAQLLDEEVLDLPSVPQTKVADAAAVPGPPAQLEALAATPREDRPEEPLPA